MCRSSLGPISEESAVLTRNNPPGVGEEWSRLLVDTRSLVGSVTVTQIDGKVVALDVVISRPVDIRRQRKMTHCSCYYRTGERDCS